VIDDLFERGEQPVAAVEVERVEIDHRTAPAGEHPMV